MLSLSNADTLAYNTDKERVVLNRFTEKIHDKGMLVREFCEYWEISRRTYERMTSNPSKHNKLNKMIDGVKQ